MDTPFNQTNQTLAPPAVNPPSAANQPTFQSVPLPSGISVSGQKPRSKTKDIFLVGLLLILLAGAVFGFTKVRSLLSSAVGDGCAPSEVMEQDLTANSVVISFKTQEACKMQVAYGVDEILGLQMSEQITATDHQIKLSPLMPSTPYKYQIRHDETKYEPTRGFLTLPLSVNTVTNVPTMAVPTRNVLPRITGSPGLGKISPTPTVIRPPPVRYLLEDFQLHLGSVDPRFDIDKNGIVNIRDWQLYNK